jgi:polysaccharide biosynthesis/export protein
MKWFCAVMTAVLVAIPVSGAAQESQTPPATPAPAEATPVKPADVPQTATPQTATPQPATPQTATPQPATPQATAPAAPMGGASGMVNPENYVIGADDSLQVTVWKEPTLSGVIPVRPDGMISLVLVGDLPAAGRTPMQLGDDITLRLKKYIQDPVVTVVVLAVNSQRIFMVGEIGHVGPIMLTPGMTPLQAIAAAGGLTTFAKSKHIYILRGEPGKQQKIPFNYKMALKGDNKQNVSLVPGDTVVVP